MKHESFDLHRFHVIAVISNPVRYRSRYNLYTQFKKHMEDSGVTLHTIELQLGNRPFVVTDSCNPLHTQARNSDILWHKENLIRLGIAKLSLTHPDWNKVAWIDADIEFQRKDWVYETITNLEMYQVLQLFETAIDLGPTGKTLSVHKSFMSQYLDGNCIHPDKEYSHYHPGYCWAARREAINGMGGLYERAILGAGDRHMAMAFVDKAQLSFMKGMHSAYAADIMKFQRRCHETIRRSVGIIPGTIIHFFHGKKRDRKYHSRWDILVKNSYHPHHDIKHDSGGVLSWHDDRSERFLRLRDEIIGYMHSRNEDSLDEW